MIDLNSLPEWLSWVWLTIFAATLAAVIVLMVAVARRAWHWWRGRGATDWQSVKLPQHRMLRDYLIARDRRALAKKMEQDMRAHPARVKWVCDQMRAERGDGRHGPFSTYDAAARFANEHGLMRVGCQGGHWWAAPDNNCGALDRQHADPDTPYGSAPPVNHTVERVDDLERRVAGLEKMAQALLFKKWLDDSRWIARQMFCNHMTPKAEPDDGIRVWRQQVSPNDVRWWLWRTGGPYVKRNNGSWIAWGPKLGEDEFVSWLAGKGGRHLGVELHGTELADVYVDWRSRND